MQYSNYFAHSYQEARDNFMACCAERATFVKSWQHSLRGIAGEKLYVDLAWFGDLAAKKVIVLVSGTHGIEGYCGSGIQVSSIQTGWHRQADRNLAIIMIHGLNPWGMSHLRRVNEEGVDLNRNFRDFQQPLPSNSLYDDLSEVIVPPEWTEETQVETLNQIVEYLSQSSSHIEALAQGQYHYWYAPFYGGEVPTWSNRVFCQIINQYLQNKQAVGLLDYHTGLGQYATGQLMSLAANTGETENLATAVWGNKLVITGSANSVAPYHPQGTLIAALQNKLTQSNCLAAAYEFGTITEVEVFNALRADHWLQAYGDFNTQQAQRIKQNMLNAFYSDRPDWQESICNLAFTAQQELLTGLKSM
ncbi:DUF2817 domain-containing protein [Pleurocapsa sp. PCC 7319]|uniref:DUF2817 domain-containing protein n=1 Tax=Pleurocapsa sp. PCC 7319 TaxID=118161 RepID=UPI00034B4ECC|nr:DUF2817 domain-containing protein [Pleurocapsa sp. PCC 7319]